MPDCSYRLCEEFDLAAMERVRGDLKRAISANGANLLIDCSDLKFIDSSGIAVLLEVHRDLQSQGRTMRIVNVAPRARRTFEILGLTDLLEPDTDASS